MMPKAFLQTGTAHDHGSEVRNDSVVHLLVRELRDVLIDSQCKGRKRYGLTSKREWLRRVGHRSQDQDQPGRLESSYDTTSNRLYINSLVVRYSPQNQQCSDRWQKKYSRPPCKMSWTRNL